MAGIITADLLFTFGVLYLVYYCTRNRVATFAGGAAKGGPRGRPKGECLSWGMSLSLPGGGGAPSMFSFSAVEPPLLSLVFLGTTHFVPSTIANGSLRKEGVDWLWLACVFRHPEIQAGEVAGMPEFKRSAAWELLRAAAGGKPLSGSLALLRIQA